MSLNIPGVLDERLLTASLLVQTLVGLNDIEDTGAVRVLGSRVFNIGPQAKVVMGLGLCTMESALDAT